MIRLTRSTSFFVLGIGLAGLSASLAGCGADPGDRPEDEPMGEAASPITVNPGGSSLFVNEPAVLKRFSLRRVLQQIIDRTPGIAPLTPQALYAQMFDTLNDAGHAQTSGPHCTGTINGFGAECPRTEGILAATNPFDGRFVDSYSPAAIVNRFDLAPTSGSNCGEYRIVYGKQLSGELSELDRLLVIFEGRLPNPTPELGLQGCLPVAQMWVSLGGLDSTARAAALESFFFAGLTAGAVTFEPVVDPTHYGMAEDFSAGGPSRGQIRTNMFMAGRPYFDGLNHVGDWQLREFRTRRVWDDGVRSLQIRNVAVANNPDPSLFRPNPAPGSRAETFQTVDFLAMVPRLAKPGVGSTDAALIGMRTKAIYNSGASDANSSQDYLWRAAGNAPFKSAITAKLAAIGRSDLTADDVLRRATSQSCGGCHQVSRQAPNGLMGGGIIFPHTIPGFTHINEDGGPSEAMVEVFLPHRAAVLEAFVNAPATAVQAAIAADFDSIGGDGSI